MPSNRPQHLGGVGLMDSPRDLAARRVKVGDLHAKIVSSIQSGHAGAVEVFSKIGAMFMTAAQLADAGLPGLVSGQIELLDLGGWCSPEASKAAIFRLGQFPCTLNTNVYLFIR